MHMCVCVRVFVYVCSSFSAQGSDRTLVRHRYAHSIQLGGDPRDVVLVWVARAYVSVLGNTVAGFARSLLRGRKLPTHATCAPATGTYSPKGVFLRSLLRLALADGAHDCFRMPAAWVFRLHRVPQGECYFTVA